MEIVVAIKILVVFALIAARYHDRIRDVRFGDMKVPKPKKERMKKLMKFIKRIWRFCTPGKAESRVRKAIVTLLDSLNIRYSLIRPNNDIEFRISNNEGGFYSNYIHFSSKTDLSFYVSFPLVLIPEDYDRICHLSQMFNDRMNDATLRVNMENKELILFSTIPLDYCDVNIHLFQDRLYGLDRYANDIHWSFNQLIESGEEAVFVFAEMVERSKISDSPATKQK
jgi:hypothetical protein